MPTRPATTQIADAAPLLQRTAPGESIPCSPSQPFRAQKQRLRFRSVNGEDYDNYEPNALDLNSSLWHSRAGDQKCVEDAPLEHDERLVDDDESALLSFRRRQSSTRSHCCFRFAFLLLCLACLGGGYVLARYQEFLLLQLGKLDWKIWGPHCHFDPSADPMLGVDASLPRSSRNATLSIHPSFLRRAAQLTEKIWSRASFPDDALWREFNEINAQHSVAFFKENRPSVLHCIHQNSSRPFTGSPLSSQCYDTKSPSKLSSFEVESESGARVGTDRLSKESVFEPVIDFPLPAYSKKKAAWPFFTKAAVVSMVDGAFLAPNDRSEIYKYSRTVLDRFLKRINFTWIIFYPYAEPEDKDTFHLVDQQFFSDCRELWKNAQYLLNFLGVKKLAGPLWLPESHRSRACADSPSPYPDGIYETEFGGRIWLSGVRVTMPFMFRSQALGSIFYTEAAADWTRCWTQSPQSWGIRYAVYSGAFYVYHLLFSAALRFGQFDYIMKMDVDIVWLQPVPIDIFQYLQDRSCLFLHSEAYNSWQECEQWAPEALSAYEDRFGIRAASSGRPWIKSGRTFLGNFVAARSDWLLSPSILHFAYFLYQDFWWGYFKGRWGDQATYPLFLALIVDAQDILEHPQVCDLTCMRENVFDHK